MPLFNIPYFMCMRCGGGYPEKIECQACERLVDVQLCAECAYILHGFSCICTHELCDRCYDAEPSYDPYQECTCETDNGVSEQKKVSNVLKTVSVHKNLRLPLVKNVGA